MKGALKANGLIPAPPPTESAWPTTGYLNVDITAMTETMALTHEAVVKIKYHLVSQVTVWLCYAVE